MLKQILRLAKFYYKNNDNQKYVKRQDLYRDFDLYMLKVKSVKRQFHIQECLVDNRPLGLLLQFLTLLNEKINKYIYFFN